MPLRARTTGKNYGQELRTRVPVAVIAEVGARIRVVGTIALHAVADGVIANGGRGRRHRAVVIRSVIVVSGRIGRAAIVAAATIVAARSNRAADHSTGDRAGNEAAAATAMPIVTAAASAAAVITAATTTTTAKARTGSAAAK